VATTVIVAGVVNAQRDLRLEARLADRVTVCRLRADPDRLLERLSGRPGALAVPDEVLREAQALDQTAFADLCVDTSGLSVEAVAGEVLEALADWSGNRPGPPGGPIGRGLPSRSAARSPLGAVHTPCPS
jgi:hypothetical protein